MAPSFVQGDRAVEIGKEEAGGQNVYVRQRYARPI